MRRTLRAVACLAAATTSLGAQADSSFERFRRDGRRNFDQFVASQDSAFIRLLQREWSAFRVLRASSGYRGPKPRALPHAPEADSLSSAAGGSAGVPVSLRQRPSQAPDIVMTPLPEPSGVRMTSPEAPLTPTPTITLVGPRAAPALPVSARQVLEPDYYGADARVRTVPGRLPRVAAPLTQAGIAAFYEQLTKADLRPLLEDLDAQMRELALDDFGFARLAYRLARKLSPDEANTRLVTWYLLRRGGLDARVALSGEGASGSVVLLLPSNVRVYRVASYDIDGRAFGVFNLDDGPPLEAPGMIRTYREASDASPRIANLAIRQTPQLGDSARTRTLRWTHGDARHEITIRANVARVRYLEWFPQVDWFVWFGLGMSDEARATLLPPLRQLIAGRSERDAANILIRFVQSAFAYATDMEQFGREDKPFAVDETLFYPFSDCEDRAVLFATLVRELMHREVVGVLYSTHMATAVRFTDDTSGDALIVSGVRWIVSDPTYVGADVGETMPQFQRETPEIIPIPR